jgi:hypothetical protein
MIFKQVYDILILFYDLISHNKFDNVEIDRLIKLFFKNSVDKFLRISFDKIG